MSSVSDSTVTPRQAAARPLVRAWLLVLALLVFAMVIVGGATRLTGSGLSITEWAPVTGTIPPLNEEAWEAELEKYRQIPQYQAVNRGMSLEDFKAIYWWEWGHRFLGRLVGLVFLVPFVWFVGTGRLERRMVPWVLGAFVLGGLQGALGWYMVASGLVDRISVSQYRLAAHLTLAAAIFAYLVWLADGLRRHAPEPVMPASVRATAWLLASLVLLQVALGGLVAGLDAGLTYQTWPLMDGEFVPDGLFIRDPWWINLFENVLTVQFDHRMLGYLLVALALAHVLQCVRAGGAESPAANRAFVTAGAMLAQAGIGIATLLHGVPISLALLHQGAAMVILALAVRQAGALSLAHSRARRGGEPVVEVEGVVAR